MSAPHTAAEPAAAVRLWRGPALGLLAVVLFSATLPANALALQALSPVAVSGWRATIAGFLAVGFLTATRRRLPPRAAWPSLAFSGVAATVLFPLLSSAALQHIDPARAGIILGLLPILTAMLSSLATRGRPSAPFWVLAVVSVCLVTGYLASRGGMGRDPIGEWDLVMLLATVCTAMGFAAALRTASTLGAFTTLSWGLVCVLPAAVPVTVVTTITAPPDLGAAAIPALLGLAYLGVCSQFLAFGLWYAALSRGGVFRVSQIQQLQPIFTVLWTAMLFTDPIDPWAVVVGAAVGVTVGLSQRMTSTRR